MLGFFKIHVYGLDSCYPDEENTDRHHAYEQPENDVDAKRAQRITIAPGSAYERTFLMAPWHSYQLLDFMRVSQYLLGDALVDIKGDGAIAHVVNTAAALNGGLGEGMVAAEGKLPGPICYTLAPIPLKKVS